jgi:hypothetical protein
MAAALLAAACASPPAVKDRAKPPPEPLPPLPATFINDPDCPGCLAVTLTLRPDGAYLVRDRLGASEFYDFGRWRYADGTLELAGGRDTRRYPLESLRNSLQVERLRGPFRLVGVYDGATFKECRTGVAWRLADTRAAKLLQEEVSKQESSPALVALDAQLEGTPETLRVFRPATVLDARSCPS